MRSFIRGALSINFSLQGAVANHAIITIIGIRAARRGWLLFASNPPSGGSLAVNALFSSGVDRGMRVGWWTTSRPAIGPAEKALTWLIARLAEQANWIALRRT
jgi:hypothetical protein